MVGEANSQTHALGLAHEWRHVCMTSEGMFIKRKQTLAHVGNLSKKLIIGSKTKPLNFQRVGPKNGQPRVKRL